MKRWVVFCSALMLASGGLAGGSRSGAYAAAPVPIVIEDFEGSSIDTSRWTTDGDAWTALDTANASHGTQSVTSGNGTDYPTGTMTSSPITVPANAQTLVMDIRGLDGAPGSEYPLHQNFVEVTDLSTNNVIANFVPPSSLAFNTYSVDVKALRGKQIQIMLVDGISGGWGWFGVDFIRFIPELTVSPGEIPNGDFATGDLTGWTTDGNAWGIQVRNGLTGASSSVSGEDPQGTLKSSTFQMTKRMLKFKMCGWSQNPRQEGTPPKHGDYNPVTLRKALDSSIVATLYPPDNDNWADFEFDCQNVMNQDLYILATDNAGGSFAWLAVTNFRQEDWTAPPDPPTPMFPNGNFEDGNFNTNWTVTGDAWNVSKLDGCDQNFAAETKTKGTGKTGTLRSKTFKLTHTALSCLLAGQDGWPPATTHDDSTPRSNYVCVRLADDDTIISKVFVPDLTVFLAVQFSLGDFFNRDAYIEVVQDAPTGQNSWIAVDLFQWVDIKFPTILFDDFEGAELDTTKWTPEDGNSCWTTLTTNAASHGTQSLTSGIGSDGASTNDYPTGILTSVPITVPADALELIVAIRGLDGASYPAHKNYVEVIDLSTNTSLVKFVPPQSLGFTPNSINVKALRGKQIQIKLVDSIDGGWGWFGVDHIGFSQDSSVPVELSSFTAE